MAEYMTKEEFTVQIKQITDDVVKELTQVKLDNWKTNSRLETLYRYLIKLKVHSMDSIITSLEEYSLFNNELFRIKRLQNIPEQIDAAINFNKTAGVPIYIDDLDLVSKFDQVGGPSVFIANKLLNYLPGSNRVKTYFENAAKQPPAEEILDAIVVKEGKEDIPF